MSYHVFFEFSSGLEHPIQAKRGTLARILAHVKNVETTLGLKTTQYRDNPPRWETTRPAEGVTDEVFCRTVEEHNDFVREFYHSICEWQKTPPEDAETITPEDAKKFWHGLSLIRVPVEQWTGDYYRQRMEAIYEVMRGQESEGISFGEEPLTTAQAAQVINLFSEYLDKEDLRLDVPRGHDYLASSSDGGYDWCEKCGAITYEDSRQCEEKGCPMQKKCPECGEMVHEDEWQCPECEHVLEV